MDREPFTNSHPRKDPVGSAVALPRIDTSANSESGVAGAMPSLVMFFPVTVSTKMRPFGRGWLASKRT